MGTSHHTTDATKLTYAKRAYEAFMREAKAEELAYVAGAWRSRDGLAFEDADFGIHGVWVAVAEAAREPILSELPMETGRKMLELVRSRLKSNSGLTKIAAMASNYLNDLRITAQKNEALEVKVSLALLGPIILVLQKISWMEEATEFEKATSQELPCGCKGVMRSDTNRGLWIAKVTEYCEHHHEDWYRGQVLPENYLERKVDQDRALELHHMLNSVLKGEPETRS